MRLQIFPGLDHVVDRDAFVMQTTRASPASAASMMASAAKGGGTKITEALAPVALTPSATVSNTGRLRCFWPPFAGSDSADYIGAVGDGLLAWKVPSLPVNPWTSRRVLLLTRTLMRLAPRLFWRRLACFRQW